VNQFIEHRSSTWSSSRGRYFLKKHRSFGAPQYSRYDGPVSLGERYPNYIKKNPGSTLSPDAFEKMTSTGKSVYLNQSVPASKR